LDFYKLLALEQIVVDPWLVQKDQITRGLWDDPIPVSLFAKHDPPDVERRKKLAEENHRRIGEELFSRAAIVIPIYPETNKDDINWQLVEELKKRFYGHTYRPKPDQYEKTIKVFAMGEKLREGKGYTSWQEIADAVKLPVATVRYIYDRAFHLVYGVTPDKRPYRVQPEIPATDDVEDVVKVQDVLKKEGPGLREKLTKDGAIEKYEKHGFQRKDGVIRQVNEIFDEIQSGIREKCSKCEKRVDGSEGRYSPDPERKDNEIFTCNSCLVPSR